MMYDCLGQHLYNTFEPCSSHHEIHPNELTGTSSINYVSSALTRDVTEVIPFPLAQVPMTAKKRRQVEGKRQVDGLVVDTSAFSVEERLVAAVWVHERKRSKTSMGQIKKDFLQRFSREPPAKNTLLVWERKLFSSGSVYDAPRPGRPINRANKVEEVSASLQSAPTLSLRARAAALCVPRTTLRTILQRDLQHTPTNPKRPPKRPNKKRCVLSVAPAPCVPPLLYHGYS
ncbi:uncharacterized protein LOC128678828 [Plodia interpunctella]|uniref:uncharacterized protein LOC128678828 n=1 Tax=Plodia interpunctella TaxID=58824 RepID=UPI002367B47C|nr:uncharacterized protein LOC128678828 [Plodia interpunctella]